MRIMTNKKIEEIEREIFARGRQSGFEEGKRKGAEERRVSNWREILAKFSEAPVIIESVSLKQEPSLTETFHFYSGSSAEYEAAIYEVTFRGRNTKSSVTIEMRFNTPDFSMADIRRRITREFCGCENEKGGR